eukprot:5122569-Pleurochrysis_carterae.AAC.2
MLEVPRGGASDLDIGIMPTSMPPSPPRHKHGQHRSRTMDSRLCMRAFLRLGSWQLQLRQQQ